MLLAHDTTVMVFAVLDQVLKTLHNKYYSIKTLPSKTSYIVTGTDPENLKGRWLDTEV